MENNHLTYFKVENFKKFDSLEVNDIGQFNLIVGDNNVGKTCLLEALLVIEDDVRCIENLHHTLCKRSLHIHPIEIHTKSPILPKQNYFLFLKNKINNKSISFIWKTLKNKYDYSFEDEIIENLKEEDFNKEIKHNYNIGRPNLWIKIYKNKIFSELQFMYMDDFKTKFKHGYQQYISKDAGFDLDINTYYAEKIGLADEESLSVNENNVNSIITKEIKALSYQDKQNFLDNLSLFFDDIEDVMIKNFYRDDILSIKLRRYSDFLPITYFGDGTHEYIRYLLEITKCNGKRLMIDEIGAGIHYSKLTEFWKIIIKVAIKEKVQIFSTTHSKECIDAYSFALEELGFSEQGKVILLQEEKEKIVSYTFETENLDLAFDYRG